MDLLAFFGFPPGWQELIIVGIVAVILFGKRLPEVGRSLGKGIVEFKRGLSGVKDEIEEAGEKPEPEPEPKPKPPTASPRPAEATPTPTVGSEQTTNAAAAPPAPPAADPPKADGGAPVSP